MARLSFPARAIHATTAEMNPVAVTETMAVASCTLCDLEDAQYRAGLYALPQFPLSPTVESGRAITEGNSHVVQTGFLETG